MKDIITLVTHDGSKNYLKKLPRKDGEESKTYILKTQGASLRVGNLGDGKSFIDPSGGPMIIVGQPLAEANNAVVRSIDFSEGFGYTITFV